MKNLITFLVLTFATSIFAQDFNLKQGYIAEGYDVVAYFNNKAIAGKKKFTTTYKDVKLKFSIQKNLETFLKNPDRYMPAYGGYCAYAIGAKAERVAINPKTFEIREGKLYLFYNAWGINTLKMWKKEGAEKLQVQADENWQKLTHQ